MTAKADAISRVYFISQLWRQFGHSLGHGIGLDIHEGPLLSQNSSDELK